MKTINITEFKNSIIQYLSENPDSRMSEIAIGLGVSWRTAETYVNDLMNEQRIEQIVHGSSLFYRLHQD